MTLPTSTRVTDPYETDGVQRDFEFDFPAFYNADTGHYGIEVRRLTALDYEVIDKSLYDIFLNDEDKSGYIRFHVAPMAGDDIYIAGDTTRSQQLNLINYGRYSAQSIEKAFDLIVALIQEFVSKVDEETRQRILADQALRDFLLIKFNQFTAEVTTKIDKHIGDINGFMSSLVPMFVCIMRKELAYYIETQLDSIIDAKISDLSTQVANAIAENDAALIRLNESILKIEAATTATAIGARLFDTPAAGVNPVTGVAIGSYFNVRSPNAESYVDEYQNVGGVPTPTGKSYPSNMAKWDASLILDGNKNQHEINNQQPTALQLESIGSNGILNASTGLQALATSVDLGLKPYIFLPFYNNNYKLDSTVVIQEPMMLWGDAAPTYNRGDGKNGKILLNTPIGFNLGNGRTTGAVLNLVAKTSKNPADQWTVKNLTFFPFNRAAQEYTQTAIMHDSRTNGPDRGFLMREVSASRVKHAIHIKNNDLQTHLSNLEVVNCCLSNNALPILADANVWCGRIVSSQIEQNSQGAIHGVFHSGLAIHDNMLEGNKNTIYIKDHSQDRNGCYLSLERNYFEGNYGDYFVKMDSFQSNSIISRGNYVVGFMSADGITPNTSNNRPTDHFLLTNSYTSINIHDRLAVSFYGLANCLEDNNLKKFLVYAQPGNYVRVDTRLNDAVVNYPNNAAINTIANTVDTDIGKVYEVRSGASYTVIPNLPVNVYDVIQLTFSYFSNDQSLAPTNITIAEVGGATLVAGAGFAAPASQGVIKTVNYIFTVPTTATGAKNIMFLLADNDAGQNLSIVGATAKKLGVYNPSAVNPTDNRFIVVKSKPIINKVADGLKLSAVLTETVIAAGATSVKTYTVSGATNSNRVEALLHMYDENLSVSARVSAVDTVQVSIKNNSASTITIGSGAVLSYTIY